MVAIEREPGRAWLGIAAAVKAEDVGDDQRVGGNDKGLGWGQAETGDFLFGDAERAGHAGAVSRHARRYGGLGAGFGLTMKSYRADYTFTPFGALGNVQRLSLGARW